MRPAQILHIDIDAFAAAVERVMDPTLARRPVVVGNDAGGRGLVISASYEARRLGVSPGMQLSAARRRFPDAVFLPPNPIEYERFSARLFELLCGCAPVTERATLDDFYLDLTGCERLFGNDLVKWASKLKRTVMGETGLPPSMGLAPNKMLARIATCLAKPGHLLHVFPGTERFFMEPVSVWLLPGVGRATAQRLQEFGVRRAGQLAALGEDVLRLILGPAGGELWHRADGRFLEPVRRDTPHCYITHEQVLAQDTASIVQLEGVVTLLVQKLTSDLRRHGLRSSGGELSLSYVDGMLVERNVSLAFPSHYDRDFIPPFLRALDAVFRRRVRVRRLRLRTKFVPMCDQQFDLFEEKKIERTRNVYRAVDCIREKYGFRALLAAGSLKAPS